MRLVNDPKLERLAALPLFQGVTRKDLAAVSAAAEDLLVPAHTEVIVEATTPDAVFVVVRGMLQVRSGLRIVAYLQDGDVVGETGVLTRTERSATVTTVVDSHLVRIDRRHLGSILERNPQVAERLQRLAQLRRAAA